MIEPIDCATTLKSDTVSYGGQQRWEFRRGEQLVAITYDLGHVSTADSFAVITEPPVELGEAYWDELTNSWRTLSPSYRHNPKKTISAQGVRVDFVDATISDQVEPTPPKDEVEAEKFAKHVGLRILAVAVNVKAYNVKDLL